LRITLLKQYCSYLAFYLLLRTETKDDKHPVVYKIAQLKTILEGLQGVDDKVKAYLELVKDRSSEESEEEIKDIEEEEEDDEMGDVVGDMMDIDEEYGDEEGLEGLTPAQIRELQ